MELLSQQMESFYKLPKQADVVQLKVIGDSRVGKSAFIKTVVHGSYDPYLKSQLGIDFMTREIQVEEETIVLQLWEKESTSYNGCVVVYDITNRESFTKALDLIGNLRKKHGESLPILLLANKLDTDNKREVMAFEGEMASLQLNTIYYEISCMELTNVKESLVELVTLMLTSR